MDTRSRGVLAGLALLLGAAGLAWTGRSTASDGSDEGRRMASAARLYVESLGSGQQERGTWPWEAEERFDWHFVPRERYGVRLKDMSVRQRGAAHDLLQSALSSQGYLKATGVMQLEGVLGMIEDRPEHRDPEDYYFNIFGSPSEDDPWAWRFEGHHISLNFTSAGEDVPSVTPAFIGSNPHQVGEGPWAGWRLLGAEEDLARELLALLGEEQLRTAIIGAEAPRDIVTGNARSVDVGDPEGLAASEMNDEQRSALMRLLAEFFDNVERGVADAEMLRVREAGLDGLRFAWAGGTERGEGHYFRIHGPTVLIEYDNVQNGANHVHSVWRDPANDFGDDLLRRHYEEADHHQADLRSRGGTGGPAVPEP